MAALRHLEVSGIPAIAFKGLASMARLYPKPGKRTIKDADLLVDRQYLQAALNSLSDLGFRPLENHALERLETFLDHSPGFSGNKAIVLYGPGDFELDLHWAVGVAGLEPAALLGRSETVTLFGTPVRVASFDDALLLTAKHAIRENLTVDAMCRDLLDIRLSWERSASRRNFEETFGEPGAAEQSGTVIGDYGCPQISR